MLSLELLIRSNEVLVRRQGLLVLVLEGLVAELGLEVLASVCHVLVQRFCVLGRFKSSIRQDEGLMLDVKVIVFDLEDLEGLVLGRQVLVRLLQLGDLLLEDGEFCLGRVGSVTFVIFLVSTSQCLR